MTTRLRSTQVAFAGLFLAAAADERPAVHRSRSLARGHAVVVVRVDAAGRPACSVQLGPGVTLRMVARTLGSLLLPGVVAEGRLCHVHGYVDRTAQRSGGPV